MIDNLLSVRSQASRQSQPGEELLLLLYGLGRIVSQQHVNRTYFETDLYSSNVMALFTAVICLVATAFEGWCDQVSKLEVRY